MASIMCSSGCNVYSDVFMSIFYVIFVSLHRVSGHPYSDRIAHMWFVTCLAIILSNSQLLETWSSNLPLSGMKSSQSRRYHLQACCKVLVALSASFGYLKLSGKSGNL